MFQIMYTEADVRYIVIDDGLCEANETHNRKYIQITIWDQGLSSLVFGTSL